MSNEKGINYIVNHFYYDKNSTLYYRKSVRGSIILAWVSLNDVDIWENHEMPESPDDIVGEAIIKSFTPENKDYSSLLDKLLYDKEFVVRKIPLYS